MNLLEVLITAACHVYYLFLSFSGGGSFPRKLTSGEESVCIKKMTDGDRSARGKLIEHNLRLVSHVCKKFSVSQSDQEDLLQIGIVGLIKAVDSFNPEKGSKFASYAARCIENECLMNFRAEKKTAQNVSIYDPIETDKNGNELTIIDVISTPDIILDDLDTKIKCEKLRDVVCHSLHGRDASIIWMRYGLNGSEPMTQKKVAGILGISRSYVSELAYCKRETQNKIKRHSF